MTPRAPDYRERRDKILGIVVSEYVKNITPVSSNFIVRRYHMDLSSATIRNILAELEEIGFLTHPHTSAGRVPTQDGYRYYVDHLMTEIQLLEEEKEKILMEYKAGIARLEQLLEKTSTVIADVTQYTSIITVDGSEDMIFCKGRGAIVEYPQEHDFTQIRNILKLLEEKERLLKIINRDLQKKIDVYIGQEIQCAEMEDCSLAISQYKKKDGPSGRIAVLGPTRMNYPRVVSTLDYFSHLINDLL